MTKPSTTFQLSNLVGTHNLYGVDTDPHENGYRHPDIIRFKLGRITYQAVEDPCDDYRSCMDYVAVSPEPLASLFPKPVKVIARLDGDVLELVNAKTKAVILRVGTDNADEYYPCWIAVFNGI